MSEADEKRRELAARIAKRSRKAHMLIQISRQPEKKVEIRAEFMRKEKLFGARKKIAERRSRQQP